MSDVSRWLTWKESQTFERKSCYDKSKTPPERLSARVVSDFIAETLSAMANADGGVLLVGQENLRENGEDGGGDITGLDYNQSSIDLLRSAVYSLTEKARIATVSAPIATASSDS